MKASEFKIDKAKLALVGEDRPLHDKELVTKPKSYLSDAFGRFAKNKGSVFAAIVIGILVLYSLIAPIFSPYNVSYRDPVFVKILPKSQLFENTNFWDGCSNKELNYRQFVQYYAMGVETGHNALKNQEYTVNNGADPTTTTETFNARVDSYQLAGCQFKMLTLEEYQDIQKYQDETGIEIIYPITKVSKRPVAVQDERDANFWYETKKNGSITDPINYTVDESGVFHFTNIYVEHGKASSYQEYSSDMYTSKVRLEGDTPLYDYARIMQGGTFEVRVNYYEYYIYYHTYVLHDKITKPMFLFGTTALGQDLFTCLASGARFSFLLAIVVSLVNMVVGAIYGAIEGYYGGKADLIMERISEILGAVPFMIVITLLRYHMGTSPQWLILFIAFFATGWLGMAGTVRMQFYRFKNQEYVLASRTLGASDRRIMFKHIFPNSLGTIVTSCVLVIPGMIFSETSLSYLGIINLSTGKMTSVGTLLAGGQPYLTSFPHIIIFPAVFISLLMLSFNLFGNGLRDAFNPSLRGTED